MNVTFYNVLNHAVEYTSDLSGQRPQVGDYVAVYPTDSNTALLKGKVVVVKLTWAHDPGNPSTPYARWWAGLDTTATPQGGW